MKFKDFLKTKGVSEEDYQKKEASEQAALYAEYHEASLKAIEDAVAKKANTEDLPNTDELATKEELKALLGKEEFKTVEAQVTELVKQMKTVRDEQQGNSQRLESFEVQLVKALNEALPKLKEMKGNPSNKGKEIVLTIKVATDMLTTAIDNASGVDTPVNYVYGQVTDYATDVRPDAYIVNFIDSGRTDKAALPYMDKLPTEGTMAITDEGALKPLISISFELRYSQAEKIAGRTKISEEALDDIPNLLAIIRNELKYEHDIAEQAWIFTKINAIAPAFVAGGMAASTDSPSNWDALRAAAYAVKIQSDGKYIPNLALVKSADAYNMGATKDLNGQYVIPTFVMPDGTKVSGMRVFEVNDSTIADGTFIVGDFRKLKRRVYKEFTIRIGQGIQGDATAANIVSDFESNMYTMIGESRQHLWIYENEKVAFVKSTYAAVKTAIETVAG